MDYPIVRRAHFNEKGRDAALRGDARDSCQMNWHADALKDWFEGFDSVRVKSQQSHAAPAARRHVDLRQGEAA